jgi:formate/nitrite transporter
MQRDGGFELKEKIQSLLEQDSTLVKNNTDVNLLLKSLFEVRLLAKQLYPRNEALKMILSRQDLFKGEQIAHTSINKAEIIIDHAKEIALAIDLGTFNVDDSVRGVDFTSNIRETSNAIPIDSSDSLSPSETAEKVARIDMQKVNTDAFSTFMLAILAGALIAIAAVYFTFATSQIIVTRTFTQIFGGLLFSMGLMAVVITGAQMFTGNTLGIMNIASRRLKGTKLLRNWIIVYVGNFVGSVATAGVLYMSKAWTNNGYQFGIKALMIASHKVSLGFVDAFFLGILCNSLVCLAIYLAASGKKVSDKILAIMFPTAAFIAMGFEHCVANMYFLSFGFMIKNDPSLLSAMQTAGVTVDTSHLDYIGIVNNLIPVTLGNIVGGSVFIGLMYWLAYMRNNKKQNQI